MKLLENQLYIYAVDTTYIVLYLHGLAFLILPDNGFITPLLLSNKNKYKQTKIKWVLPFRQARNEPKLAHSCKALKELSTRPFIDGCQG